MLNDSNRAYQPFVNFETGLKRDWHVVDNNLYH